MAASRVSSVFIWLLLGCFLSFRRHVSGKSKHVSITLDAKWENTPILLEASEFLAKEKNEYFWGFVEDVAKMKPDRLHTESNQSLYSMILQLTAKHMSSLQLNLLKLSLSLRTASPVIAMHNQIAKEDSLAQECETFVNIHGQGTCDPEKLKELIEQVKSRPPSPIFKFDHHFPGSGNSGVTVILYAEIGRASFQKFHFLLSQMAIKREVNYILRHYVQKPSEKKVRLSGYGVELAIKSTEYKAKDDTKVEDEKYKDGEDEEAGEDEVQGFIFSKLRQLYPDMKEQLKEFQNHLIDTTKELAPLKVWQLQDLSLQAAQWVVSASSDALQVLKEICQNFPTQARSLVRTPVKDELRKEIEKNQKFFENQHNIYPGDSILLINGLPVDMEVYDIFSLLDIMWSEAAVMDGLHSMGVREQSVKLLKIDLKGGGDDYALDFRHSAVEYINNLESDSKYRHWPSSIQEMLRPTFPGMLRHIGKNIFHMVFILNPADPHSTELLKIAEAFYVHSAPVRIGLVFSVNSSQEVNGHMDAGVAFTRAFNFIKIDKSPSAGLSFVTDVYEKTKKKEMTAEFVVKEFASRFPDEDVDKVFGDDDDYDDVRKAARDFLTKSGLSDLPQILLNGVPLKKEYLTPDTLEEGVVTAILESTSDIQKAVYKGEIDDGTTILNWLMEKEHVLPRMNSRILSPPAMLLDLTENVDKDIFEDPETFGQLTSKDMSSVLVQNVHYISRKDDESRCVVTIWIVTDLETSEGRELVYSAIKSLKYSSNMRIGIIFNSDSHEADVISVNKAVYVALKTLHGHMLKSLVTKLVKEENVAALKSGEKTLQDLEVYGMDMAAYLKSMKAQDDKYLISYRSFVEKVINMEKSALAVIANGKVIGPLSESKLFIQEDFNLLEKHTMQSVAKKVATHIEAMGLEGKEASDLILRVSALLSSKPSSESRKDIKFHSDQHSVVKIQGGDPSSPVFEVEAILDPVSMEAQKLVPILLVLSEVTNVDIKIFMNSKDKLSEMPLKNFYRYVLEPEISFRNDETFSSGPAAKFTDLPQKSLLTVNMYPPESWLVEAVRSPHDLDNILLEEKESGVLGEFELENILLEGHCHDSITGQPPRGLQFTLGTNSTTVTVDTIVMANLGYFQLKANPGAWLLRLRDGRSLDIYEITSHEFTDTPLGSKDAVVTIDSFKSKTIRVKVSKKVEKMNEELLKEDDENKGIWDSISSAAAHPRIESLSPAIQQLSADGSFRSTDDKEDKDTTLNIFSLASGHLYERFLRIMMLSVIKNTKSKVKFWFLKNYLSPTVKDFIPHMAKEYGFEYELVQYKWPRWLNQQKEKQRIIWGYKILFLDVLFPLHVKKIIFVDADQIVRTDMQELYDLDLGSAPYGYTPFCDSRKEMDGFRFWKSGYWASHLAGRKYHISALYVVDLKRFRRIAAGDRLRGQYQGLSQDPNSLSNLDQDLPNNMIHQVNIKSLPQEWLWCETWCSTEELKNAKTIDLCNNPMTKEPKLQAAMRILPEWKDYDYEIKVLWDKIYNTSTRLQTEYEKPVADTSEKDRSRDEL